MLQYVVIAGLIQFAFHLVQILDIEISKRPQHHNSASSMLYGWCDTGSCSSFLNSLLHIDSTLGHQSKRLYSTAKLSSLCAPWLTHSKIVLLPQQWFLYSNSAK